MATLPPARVMRTAQRWPHADHGVGSDRERFRQHRCVVRHPRRDLVQLLRGGHRFVRPTSRQLRVKADEVAACQRLALDLQGTRLTGVAAGTGDPFGAALTAIRPVEPAGLTTDQRIDDHAVAAPDARDGSPRLRLSTGSSPLA